MPTMGEVVFAQYMNLIWMLLFVAAVAGPIVASIDGWSPLPSLRLYRVKSFATPA